MKDKRYSLQQILSVWRKHLHVDESSIQEFPTYYTFRIDNNKDEKNGWTIYYNKTANWWIELHVASGQMHGHCFDPSALWGSRSFVTESNESLMTNLHKLGVDIQSFLFSEFEELRDAAKEVLTKD